MNELPEMQRDKLKRDEVESESDGAEAGGDMIRKHLRCVVQKTGHYAQNQGVTRAIIRYSREGETAREKQQGKGLVEEIGMTSQ